ncbi:MAG: methyltransferase domain-containing protein [Woeseia sp.]
MTEKDSAVVEPWTAYWRTGTPASCFNHENTEVRLAQVWQEFVDGLRDDARLLDLATGNGTVARSCAASARALKRKLNIEAVDAAAIDPPACVADPQRLFQQIRFRGAVRLEALPFPDGAFDGVVSQFGFEYAEEAGAASEAARVLATGGKLRLVMHARDGAVSRDIGLRLERLNAALAPDGPITLVRDLSRAAVAGDRKTIAVKSSRLPAAAALVRRLAENPLPDDAALFYSSEFLKLWAQRARYWPADLSRSTDDGWNNASGVASRQEQMLRAGREEEDVGRIGARFVSAGLLLDPVNDIKDEQRGVRIAWMLSARKPANALT